MQTNPTRAPRDLANLDFIRSVAVLLVVLSHLLQDTGHPQFGWWGITGVCIFFVHTSLVLMFSLERDQHTGRFYLRRAFRIYPLWLAVLAFMVLAKPSISTRPDALFQSFPIAWRTIASSATLIGNVSGGSVVPAGWTLPIEIQMYLFLPFLFFFVRSTRTLWPLLVIDAFIAFYDFHNFPVVYSALPMCIPYFLPGIMAYVLSRRVRPNLPSWSLPVLLFAAIAVDWAVGSFRHSWFFCAALGLSLPFFRQIASPLFNRICHLVARYSYGIYLSHSFALLLAIHTLRNHSMLLRVAAFFAVFALVPIAAYHLLEEPMIRLGSRLARRIESGPSPRVDERLLDLEPAP